MLKRRRGPLRSEPGCSSVPSRKRRRIRGQERQHQSTGEHICPDCRGSGRREGSRCETCGGTGRVVEGIGGA